MKESYKAAAMWLRVQETRETFSVGLPDRPAGTDAQQRQGAQRGHEISVGRESAIWPSNRWIKTTTANVKGTTACVALHGQD